MDLGQTCPSAAASHSCKSMEVALILVIIVCVFRLEITFEQFRFHSFIGKYLHAEELLCDRLQ